VKPSEMPRENGATFWHAGSVYQQAQGIFLSS
jgi:hypothetical protein